VSDSSSSPTLQLLRCIRSPREFWGGLGLVLLAAIAWWAARELPGQSGFALGPGTAPRLFILLLAANGLGLLAIGLWTDGPPVGQWNFRAASFVLGSVLAFTVSIRPLGLVFSIFTMVVISGAASTETKWVLTIIWGAVLSVFCAFMFSYLLNLPMQLWPQI